MVLPNNEEQQFLAEVNSYLPPDVDWKAGAITYLRELIHEEGSHNQLYHLIKPFIGGPDFSPFFLEMYAFLNMLEKLALPMQSSVLDVACGPGWTSHYLAKLGHKVCGIDISEDLIKIARKRIESEPFRVYQEKPLSAKFLVQDIELHELDENTLYDAAFFESALHHFSNPVQALRNVSKNLKPDGVICVRESVAPAPGTIYFDKHMELMKKYHTLERPYTRDQMIRLLRITGYNYFEFFAPVNGFFNANNRDDLKKIKNQLVSQKNWNIFIASRKESFFKGRNLSDQIDCSYGFFNVSRITENNHFTLYLKKKWRILVSLYSTKSLGNDQKFLTRIYKVLLDREPDHAGLDHYLKMLSAGSSRYSVILSIMKSEEYEWKSFD